MEKDKVRARYDKSTIELAGSGAEYATPEEMKRLLEKLREEDVWYNSSNSLKPKSTMHNR